MKTFFRIMTAAAAGFVFISICAAATYAGAYYYFKPSLPSADTLREVKLQTPLKIFSRDGQLMAQIGEKRRTPVLFEDIPDVVVNAFLAAEDDRFFEHPGFDYQGILRAAANLALAGSRSQGGSTITQQLARVYFLSRERTFVRKAKELLLATEIEREFSKEEIIALYLNKIFLGQRAYGVGAAAEVYFGKRLSELSVAEAAVIAGIPKAPSVLNPVSDVVRATERRAYVLRRMLELDFIDQSQYAAALATPVKSRLHGPRVSLDAPYVTEMVRAELVKRYGQNAYTDGYRVVTTIDSRLQRAAERALRRALLEYDRRHGYRGPVAQAALEGIDEGASATDLQLELSKRLRDYPSYDSLKIAIVTSLADDNSAEVFVRDIGPATITWENLKWRPYVDDNRIGDAPESASDMVAPGDVVYLLDTGAAGWRLAQMPEVQGAFVALDPKDGATVALTGGFDFFASKFNRAVQAKRQPGSSFKPFIYSAALENGYTTATLVNDAPVVFDDAGLEEAWRPENYSRKFNGPTRLREALVRSLNLVSVRILLGTGISPALRHLEPFGLPDSATPRNISMALGSGGISPWDIAAGYSVFASGGYRTDHYLIERIYDANDRPVYEIRQPYVCRPCAPRRGATGQNSNDSAVRTPLSDRSSVQVPGQLTIVEPSAAEFDSEVPDYANAEQMMAHGMEWRPTRDEAPRFYAKQHEAPRQAITAENAYLVYDMMRDVIQRGTGRRARELGRTDIAGKTGTSNDRRDAWFSGYNGNLVGTAWVGFDEARSLGAGEEGGRTALPMWKYFMADALANAPDGTIERPSGIVMVRIVAETGLVAPSQYSGAIFELFREDHVPQKQGDESGSGYGTESFDNMAGTDDDIF